MVVEKYRQARDIARESFAKAADELISREISRKEMRPLMKTVYDFVDGNIGELRLERAIERFLTAFEIIGASNKARMIKEVIKERLKAEFPEMYGTKTRTALEEEVERILEKLLNEKGVING